MTLTRAWIALIILSSIVSIPPPRTATLGPWVALALLLLCYAKGRLVLDHYLGLSRAPSWKRGFAWGWGLILAGCYGLYIYPLL